MKFRFLALFATCALTVGLLSSPASADDTSPPKMSPAVAAARNASGITVQSARVINDRQIEYTVASEALKEPVRIDVVLPENYDPAAAKRYPTLYLYHGTGGTPQDWTNGGNLLQTTKGVDLITVLPESGYDGDGGGWFVNWWNQGNRGNPRWEDFIIDQVTGWVDANFKTIADRDHRAVAGLSQGGFGAMHAAARHPDMYTSVASFSGAPEIYRNPAVRIGAETVIEGTTWVTTQGNTPFSAFGDALTNATHWAGHDPGTMVENLRGMDIGLWTATGIPGELDGVDNAYGGLDSNAIEFLTHVSTVAFEGHLQDAGIPSYYDDYVFGTHSFTYWARDLEQYLPRLMERFAQPVTPAKKSYMSIESEWSQWGWHVKTNRQSNDERFTFLTDADAKGFTFKGRNKADVTTPAAYVPLRTYVVQTASGSKSTKNSVKADDTGRLTVSLDLGKAALPADLSFLGLPGGIGTLPDKTVNVSITPAPAQTPQPPSGKVIQSDAQPLAALSGVLRFLLG